VIVLPLWDPQRRRSFLGGSELQIKSLVFCLFEFFSICLTLEACFLPNLYICCVLIYIYGSRRFLASKLNSDRKWTVGSSDGT
jgi:hypothetical protein